MNTTRKRVLVAEDSPAVARVIQFNLGKAGCEVTLAANGLQAWEHAQEQQFDIVLMDQQMPELTWDRILRSIAKAAKLRRRARRSDQCQRI